MPFVWWRGAEQVETDGMFHVRRIEIGHILNPVTWHVVEQFIRQIAVRINYGNSVSSLDVLLNQVAKQGRFARPTFPDGVEVMSAVTMKKPEK